MSPSKNLKLAQLAVEYTNALLSKGSSNKWRDMILTYGMNGWLVGAMREHRDKFSGIGGMAPDAPPELQMLPKIRWMAKAAKEAEVGNCSECASVAFMFLRDIHRVRRLDWMHYLGPGDHAWVVIGRAKNSSSGDYRTWGPSAVVCDPWGEVAFMARDVPHKLPAYNKYSQYGYGSLCVTS